VGCWPFLQKAIRSWSAFELTRLARTTAQLIVVGVVASIEPIVRTVVLDSVDLEALILDEPVVTGFRPKDDVSFRAGDVKVVLDKEIAASSLSE
jgi:hypothetical protein